MYKQRGPTCKVVQGQHVSAPDYIDTRERLGAFSRAKHTPTYTDGEFASRPLDSAKHPARKLHRGRDPVRRLPTSYLGAPQTPPTANARHAENAAMKYAGRELPFTSDAGVQEIAVALGALRAEISGGLRAIVECYRDRTVDPGFRMCCACVLRMLECSISLEYLIAKGRHRDAATLLITLVELRLDLQYAALDESRVATWLSNLNRGRKPWRVATQIKSLFSESEQAAELEVYRDLSMVKHANPASGPAGFPVTVDADSLSLFHEQVDHNLSIAYLFGAAANIKDGFSAATQLVDSAIADLAFVFRAIDTAMKKLNDVHTAHVRHTLRALSVPNSDA